jgi:hypothetical protein
VRTHQINDRARNEQRTCNNDEKRLHEDLRKFVSRHKYLQNKIQCLQIKSYLVLTDLESILLLTEFDFGSDES